MTYFYTIASSPARALTLAFWTGVIQISLAFFKMGEFGEPWEVKGFHINPYIIHTVGRPLCRDVLFCFF